MKNKKSTKKFSVIAPIVFGATMTSLGLVALGTTLTSCGQKTDTKVTVTATGDEHFDSINVTGEAALNKDLTINVSFKIGTGHSGWQTIGDATVVKVGTKTLTKDTDYTIDGNANKIIVKANAVNANQVTVNVVSGPSFGSYYSWWDEKETGIITIEDGLLLAAVPGQKITTENVIVYGVKGDGSYEKAKPGKNINNYEIFYNGNNITDMFVSQGFEFKEDMIDKTKTRATQLPIKIEYHTQTGTMGGTMFAFCGNKPTTGTLTTEIYKGKVQVEKLALSTEYNVEPIAGLGEYYQSDYEFVGDNLGCTLEGSSAEGWTLTTGTTAGTIKIKQTSALDETVTETLELEIVE